MAAAVLVAMTSGALAAAPANASGAALASPPVAPSASAQGLGPRILLSLRAGPTATDTIAALAAAHNVSPATRQAALAQVAPPASAAAAVTSWAVGVGLSVVPIDAWSLEIDGPAATEAAQFGDGSLVPGALSSVVSAAVPAGRSVMSPHAATSTVESPADLASAYDQTGSGTGAGITVASVQFEDWAPGDAQTWAAAQNPPVSLSPGQIQTIQVTPTLTEPAAHDYNQETALDVDAILAAAPAANQLVYEADNGDAVAIYDRLAADAAAGKFQVLTTSWGLCEGLLGPQEEAILETDLQRIVAAGVTVTAASGDAGAYDCDVAGETTSAGLAVDFPASSPYVVGVGGTTLTGNPSVGWSESAWSSAPDQGEVAYQGDGTGGGASIDFPAPDWQKLIGVTSSQRLVPDISLDADPSTGFQVYASENGGGQASPIEGGTSLSAPLFAGQLASLLSTAACTASCGGFGDIHAALYSAAASSARSVDFRDATSGTNHYFTAGVGYDETTGLGSPQIAALASAFPQRMVSPTGSMSLTPTVLAADPCPCGDPVLVAPRLSNHRDVTVSVLGGAGDTFALVTGNAFDCSTGVFSSAAPTSVHLVGDGTKTLTLLSRDPNNGCHVSDATVRLDTTPPTAHVSGGLLTPAGSVSAAGSVSIVRLRASEAATQRVTVQRLGGRPVTVFGPVGTSAAAISLTLPAGVYRVTAIPTDLAGNRGAAVTSTWAVPLDSSLRRSSGWSLSTRVRGAYAGTVLTTGHPGSTLTGKGYGSSLVVRYRCQPSGGVLQVLIDGRVRTDVNTSCANAAFRTARVKGFPARDHIVALRLVAGGLGSVDDVAFGV